MGRAFGCLVLVAVLVLTGCGSSGKSKRRDAVNNYLDRVDQIQQHFRPSFALANQAYRDFSKAKPNKRQIERLRGAEVSILAARDALQGVTPPEDARKLHEELLQLYDLNATLGLEVITLQQFLPGVQNVLTSLGGVNKSYRKNLSGYVSYQRRNEDTGLENQCWKDSWDSISYRNGEIPGFPRATCELQGYAYDAKVRGARLARLVWKDQAYADKLEHEAADLKRRFNRDFWVEDGEYFALALDSEGKQVDALSSNNGHLLWSGIVDKTKAKAVAQNLMGPRLFSGWGIRTLAEGEGRYNPIGYHVGTVWPFDSSFVAWGLQRYGFKNEAAQIAAGILDAAECFQGRLPEAFGGYPRSLTKYPVQYPTACSPQAWSTGAPLLLIRTMLGLEPLGEHLVIDPALPAGIGRLELLDIPGRWGRIDAFGRGRVPVDDTGSRRQLGFVEAIMPKRKRKKPRVTA